MHYKAKCLVKSDINNFYKEILKTTQKEFTDN